jgi:hypothetical protein
MLSAIWLRFDFAERELRHFPVEGGLKKGAAGSWGRVRKAQ